QTSAPCAIVTKFWLPNVTGVSVPSCALPAKDCSATLTRLSVTARSPNTFENRKRIVSPHRSGLITMRIVWSTTPSVVTVGNGYCRSGCATGEPTPNTVVDADHVATHFSLGGFFFAW